MLKLIPINHNNKVKHNKLITHKVKANKSNNKNNNQPLFNNHKFQYLNHNNHLFNK